MMAAAFRVKSQGPGGDCPDGIVPFDSPGECVAEFADRIKDVLVSARGGDWEPHDVTIIKIEYVGPWFTERRVGVRN